MTERTMERPGRSWPPPPLPLGWNRVLLFLCCLAIFTLSSYPDLHPPGAFGARDKVAHLIEYSVFGHLLGRVFWETSRERSRRRLVLALVLGVAFGATDECYQHLVPGRTRSGWDLLADGVGVLLGLATSWRAAAPAAAPAGAAGREESEGLRA